MKNRFFSPLSEDFRYKMRDLNRWRVVSQVQDRILNFPTRPEINFRANSQSRLKPTDEK